MKKLSELRLFGLVFILIGALIFIGINSLEAGKRKNGGKKPGKKPGPEYTWQVEIPGEESEYNLFGYYPQQHNIFEDMGVGDGIYVGVERKGGRKGAESRFRLAVFNNIDESGQCVPWDDGPKKIGFQGIVITDHWDAKTIDSEYPCFFPTYPYPDCEDPAWGKLGRPGCMAAFLQNPLLHPYCDPDCGHPECSYEYVEIGITVNCNFEDIGGVPATPSGDVQIRVVNTFDLQEGCEYPHNISSHLSEQFYEGGITVVKLDDVDAWEITVDADIIFTEIYKGTWRNNRWEYKIPYWAQIPLKFKTTWIRNKVTAN